MEIQSIGSGMYVMDGQTYDMSTLLMAVGFERANIIEAQILDQVRMMKRRNKMLEGLSKILGRLSGMPKGDKDNSHLFHAKDYDTGVPKYDENGNVVGTYSAKELFEELDMGPLKSEDNHGGVDWVWGYEERQEAIELIKAKMDSLNSDSQMDMIRLQGLVQKRDTVYQSITNLMKKDQQSKDTIVSNLR